MQGKYSNWLSFVRAYSIRQYVRYRLRNIVAWPDRSHLEPGCTAIIGVCHRLPGVLAANLSCLATARWPDLTEIVLVVDGPTGCLDAEVISRISSVDGLPRVQIHYYSDRQAQVAESLRLPYVYAWLSWSIALAKCHTKHALIHDYDALVFGDTLAKRYEEFVSTGSAIQGISWYQGNGINHKDRLATTFEAFVDVEWVRSRKPLSAFHKIRMVGGRALDYDTLLDLQHNFTAPSKRTISAMDADSIVHPSQMIHQYTMFRRYPGKSLPCFAMPMIPFFEFLSGNENSLRLATDKLNRSGTGPMDFLGDTTSINLSSLTLPELDWALKQMVQACLKLELSPSASIYNYGQALYKAIDVGCEEIWRGDFTSDQRGWIEASMRAAVRC